MTDRETDKQMYYRQEETGRKMDGKAERYAETDRRKERQGGRQTDNQTYRHTYKHTQAETLKEMKRNVTGEKIRSRSWNNIKLDQRKKLFHQRLET